MGLYMVSIKEQIQRRRLQLLIHSYIYYELNNNIISDTTWDKWAKELVKLQQQYPEESKQVKYYELFKDFDGNTGYHLAKNADDATIGKAYYLLGGRIK